MRLVEPAHRRRAEGSSPSAAAKLGVASFALSALVAFAPAGCRTATQMTVEVTTDLDCALINSTSIAVGSVAEIDSTRPAASVSAVCVGGRIGALVVTPGGHGDADVALRVVAGLGAKTADQCVADDYQGGCIVSRRALRFTPHTELRVPIAMRASCRDVPCATTPNGGLSTCVYGQCVSATVKDPAACARLGCDEHVVAPTAGSSDGSGTWVDMAPASDVGFAGRSDAVVVWTGKAMIVWGGDGANGFGSDGASYDPIANRWTMLPATTTRGRTLAVSAWSGAEMLIWGGKEVGGASLSDGARYSPSRKEWRAMATSPLSVRRESVGVWSTTTNELLVWGGFSADHVLDGAAYDPSADRWRSIARSPLTAREQASAVWNGSKMIVFGGYGDCPSARCADGAAYDPKTDTWTSLPTPPPELAERASPVALATGATASLATFFAGGYYTDNLASGTGATFDPVSKTWAPIAAPPAGALAVPERNYMAGWWAAGRMWLWGGCLASTALRGDGASYDPIARTWVAIPSAGAPSARHRPATAWTGREMIVWSGATACLGGQPLEDGKMLRP